jgi:hypothetical protein
MSADDLKSRTPGPLDDASRTFADRVASRGEGMGGTSSDLNRPSDTADPDPEIDDTSLPLDNRSDGTVTQAVEDVDDGDESQPQANNPDDAGEDESVVR